MKQYVLTGGATGIGAAIKQRLRDAGDQVFVIDLRDADVCADLSTATGRSDAIAATLAAIEGEIDGVITCAGVASNFPDKRKIIEVNYYGTVELITGLAGKLSANANLLLISSNSAPQCSKPALVEAMLQNDLTQIDLLMTEASGHDCYSGSKQAVAKWMRREAPNLARQGKRINAIAPGYIDTPMTQAGLKDPQYGAAIQQFVDSIPIGRPGKPEDIANAAEFLMSDKASFISGSVLFVDGAHDAMFRPTQV